MSDFRSRTHQYGGRTAPIPKLTPKPNGNGFYKKQKKRPVKSIPLDLAKTDAKRIIAKYNRGNRGIG